ncbi:CDP-diacylglycerol--glycerol-3-phosphate 3-phosphatidyltransferase [Thoreauomyces humboldtii]|nr:CDP-diacylglycerol--glycerol-3-phosphate 3-phosphatidyltransferase [Thoreauomyces humboldtii]
MRHLIEVIGGGPLLHRLPLASGTPLLLTSRNVGYRFASTLRRSKPAGGSKRKFSTQAPWPVHFQNTVADAAVFPCKPDNVKVLDAPVDFYGALEHGISTAKDRIVLASLYLGTGEERVVKALQSALERNFDLQVTILFDHFRGTRGKNNSVTMLAPLLAAYPNRIVVSLYHTPAVGWLLKKIVPPRFNEAFGLQHMKIYIFDNDLLLSGANLNTDYFTDRQDRYILFRNHEKLVAYYADLVDTVCGFSFSVTSPTALSTIIHPPFTRSLPTRLDRRTMGGSGRAALSAFSDRWRAKTSGFRESIMRRDAGAPGTVVVPVIQMAQLGARQEEAMLTALLGKDLPVLPSDPGEDRWTVHLASGYLNFPAVIMDLLLRSTARFSVLTAAPEANGFFGSKGVSRHLPAAYTHLEKRIMDRAARAGRQASLIIYEWMRSGWTFHAKGLWCTPPNESTPVLTTIGSSNFGYRSVYRDIEAQALLITSDPGLRTRLEENRQVLWSKAKVVERKDLEAPDREVATGVAITTRIIRSML